MRETTALGAAIAAGLAVGVWRSFAELRDVNRAGGKVFQPRTSVEDRETKFAAWTKAVEKCRGWVDVPGKPKEEKLPPLSKPEVSKFRQRIDSAVSEGNVDLDGMDEEDLNMELRKIEILQNLKKLRAGRRSHL